MSQQWTVTQDTPLFCHSQHARWIWWSRYSWWASTQHMVGEGGRERRGREGGRGENISPREVLGRDCWNNPLSWKFDIIRGFFLILQASNIHRPIHPERISCWLKPFLPNHDDDEESEGGIASLPMQARRRDRILTFPGMQLGILEDILHGVQILEVAHGAWKENEKDNDMEGGEINWPEPRSLVRSIAKRQSASASSVSSDTPPFFPPAIFLYPKPDL